MKKVLLLVVIFMVLLPLASRKSKADDPGFCIEGWLLVEEAIEVAGGGCIVYKRTYNCQSEQREITCHEYVCPGGMSMVLECN